MNLGQTVRLLRLAKKIQYNQYGILLDGEVKSISTHIPRTWHTSYSTEPAGSQSDKSRYDGHI